MSENAKNPAATNPSKADTSDSYDYESAWKGLNQILFITQFMMSNADAYEQAIQDKLYDIQLGCTNVFDDKPENPAWGKLSASDAAKLITPWPNRLRRLRSSPTHPFLNLEMTFSSAARIFHL